MYIDNKKFRTLNMDLRDRFGCKIVKLSINAGMTCPNRDGSIGDRGCLFCGEAGAGEFAGDVNQSITVQLKEQVEKLKTKWQNAKYIAYFQSYTNTYDTVENLRKIFEEALSFPNVVGLAIATRPDCLSDDIIELLEELNNRTFLWLELGIQTIHENTSSLIRRGYSLEYYETIHEKLQNVGIREVIHVIVGLPHETKEMILDTAKYVSKLDVYGIKIHMLHILKNTDLEHYYNNNEFELLTLEEYISTVVDIIEVLPENMTIHRLTGDGKKDLLIEPWWSLNKRAVLNGIDKEIVKRGTWQSKRFLK